MKDKKTDGYPMGQSIVFPVLITPIVTIPAGFMFQMPDPKLTERNRLKKQLRKSGISYRTGNCSDSSETLPGLSSDCSDPMCSG